MQALTPKGTQTKKRIFQTSIALMHEKGFENTTMKDISKKSGVGIGTIYHHFKNKIDILLQFVENEQAEIEEFLMTHNFNTIREKIEALIELQYQYLEIKHKEFLAAFTANSLLNPQPDDANPFLAFITRHLLNELLIQGESTHEFTCRRSPNYVTEVIAAIMVGHITIWASARCGNTDESDHDALVQYKSITLETLDLLLS